MTEFLNNIPKDNVQFGIALIFLLVVFMIVFALTFVPNPKDSHRKREMRSRRRTAPNHRRSIIRDIEDGKWS